MSIKRIVAIVGIFALACAGWSVLGSAIAMRTSRFSGRLASSVHQLWGEPIEQTAPTFTVQVPGTDRNRAVLPVSHRIVVDLGLEHRKKGLTWYAIYTSAFDATYEIRNDEAVSQKVRVSFDFPNQGGTYDGVLIQLDKEPLHVPLSVQDGLREIIEVAPGHPATCVSGTPPAAWANGYTDSALPAACGIWN